MTEVTSISVDTSPKPELVPLKRASIRGLKTIVERGAKTHRPPTLRANFAFNILVAETGESVLPLPQSASYALPVTVLTTSINGVTFPIQ